MKNRAEFADSFRLPLVIGDFRHGPAEHCYCCVRLEGPLFDQFVAMLPLIQPYKPKLMSTSFSIAYNEVNHMYYAGLRPLNESQEHEQTDDDALVAAAQSGSESAFRELCRRNAGQVFRSISRVTKHHADAEDALQDSLIRAFVHLQQFDRRSQFSTWLTRIGINSALMILRKKRRHCETPFDSMDSDENARWQWGFADIAASPEECCLLNDMRRTMDGAICRLPLQLRVVAEMRLINDLSMREIAATLNISIPATKSRLLRAKRRIVRTLHGNTTQDTQKTKLRAIEHPAKTEALGVFNVDGVAICGDKHDH
jgi:RNA polymerase sigma-70 factor, ECF subfamily